MTTSAVRHVTLDVNGDLINLNNGSYVDYSVLHSDTVKNIGDSYEGMTGLNDYSNEVFINMYVKKAEWSSLLLDKDILIPSINTNFDGYIWNDIVNERNKSAEVFVLSFWLAIVYIFKFSAVALLFPLFCFLKSFVSRKTYPSDLRDISVVRSKASFDKILSIRERFNLLMISEDMVYKNDSLDSIFSFVSPLSIFLSYPKIVLDSCKDLYFLRSELLRFLSKTCTNRILVHYSARIVLKCSYEALLENIIKRSKVNLFTGNKEDRFAMVETRLAKKYGVRLVCIPHGLEYAYKFPNGVAGDVFYCTSNASATALAKIYRDDKFVFDQAVNNEIYGGAKVHKEIDSAKIVFFTEPRNVQVNRLIIKILEDNNIAFRVKLHPADRSENYEETDLDFVEIFPELLLCSTWVARKSTVLVEALYRGAESIAILVDSKDEYYANNVFPSLSDASIRKVYSESELVKNLH